MDFLSQLPTDIIDSLENANDVEDEAESAFILSEKFGVADAHYQFHSKSRFTILKPRGTLKDSSHYYENDYRDRATINITFTPSEAGRQSEVFIIRNNLTILDLFVVTGVGVANSVNFSQPILRNMHFDLEQYSNFDDKLKEGENPTYMFHLLLIADNYGDISLFLKDIFIEDMKCSGFGLMIMNCDEHRNFRIPPKSSYRLRLLYTPDVTLFVNQRNIRVFATSCLAPGESSIGALPEERCTNGTKASFEAFRFNVTARIPNYIFKRYEQLVFEMPNLYRRFHDFSTLFMILMTLVVFLLAFLESDRIISSEVMKWVYEPQKVLNLKKYSHCSNKDEISELMDAENDESLAKMRYSVGGRHSNGYIKVFECVLKKYHWLKNLLSSSADFVVPIRSRPPDIKYIPVQFTATTNASPTIEDTIKSTSNNNNKKTTKYRNKHLQTPQIPLSPSTESESLKFTDCIPDTISKVEECIADEIHISSESDDISEQGKITIIEKPENSENMMKSDEIYSVKESEIDNKDSIFKEIKKENEKSTKKLQKKDIKKKISVKIIDVEPKEIGKNNSIENSSNDSNYDKNKDSSSSIKKGKNKNNKTITKSIEVFTKIETRTSSESSISPSESLPCWDMPSDPHNTGDLENLSKETAQFANDFMKDRYSSSQEDNKTKEYKRPIKKSRKIANKVNMLKSNEMNSPKKQIDVLTQLHPNLYSSKPDQVIQSLSQFPRDQLSDHYDNYWNENYPPTSANSMLPHHQHQQHRRNNGSLGPSHSPNTAPSQAPLVGNCSSDGSQGTNPRHLARQCSAPMRLSDIDSGGHGLDHGYAAESLNYNAYTAYPPGYTSAYPPGYANDDFGPRQQLHRSPATETADSHAPSREVVDAASRSCYARDDFAPSRYADKDANSYRYRADDNTSARYLNNDQTPSRYQSEDYANFRYQSENHGPCRYQSEDPASRYQQHVPRQNYDQSYVLQSTSPPVRLAPSIRHQRSSPSLRQSQQQMCASATYHNGIYMHSELSDRPVRRINVPAPALMTDDSHPIQYLEPQSSWHKNYPEDRDFNCMQKLQNERKKMLFNHQEQIQKKSLKIDWPGFDESKISMPWNTTTSSTQQSQTVSHSNWNHIHGSIGPGGDSRWNGSSSTSDIWTNSSTNSNQNCFNAAVGSIWSKNDKEDKWPSDK